MFAPFSLSCAVRGAPSDLRGGGGGWAVFCVGILFGSIGAARVFLANDGFFLSGRTFA